MQVAVASTDTRIGNTHSRVTLYEEQGIELVTDEELAELCHFAQELTICLAYDRIIDLIDGLGASASGRVFM